MTAVGICLLSNKKYSRMEIFSLTKNKYALKNSGLEKIS